MKRLNTPYWTLAVLVLALLVGLLFLVIQDAEKVLPSNYLAVAKYLGAAPLVIRLIAAGFAAGLLLALVHALVGPLVYFWRAWHGNSAAEAPLPGPHNHLVAVEDIPDRPCPRCSAMIPPPVRGWQPGVEVRCLRGCQRDFIVAA